MPVVVYDVGDAWIDDGRVARVDAGFVNLSPPSGFGAMLNQKSSNPAPLIPGLSPEGKRWSVPPSPWVNTGHEGWVSLGTDVDGQAWIGHEQSGFPYGNWGKTQKSSSFLSDLGSVAKAALPIAATVASFVPGIGTGVALALNTANQLAQGKSLSEAALAAAKNSLPGGPLAAAAFDAAVSVAKGENVGAATLSAARSAAVAQGGPLAGAAFDAGLAAAKGKNVIDAAKGAALNAAIAQLPGGVTSAAAAELTRRVVAGENVASAALAVGGEAARAAAEKALPPMANPLASIRQYVPGAMQGTALALQAAQNISGKTIALPQPTSAMLSQGAKMASAALLQTPHLQGMPAQQVAEQLGVPVPAVREAIGAIVSSAKNSNPVLSKSSDAMDTVGARTTLQQALAATGNSAVAPPALGPTPGAVNPFTGQTGQKAMTIAVPPKKMLMSILRHLPRAHRVPLFRLWKQKHGIKQDAGRLPLAGEKSVKAGVVVRWPVVAGEYPILISKRVTGDERRYKELFASNPTKALNATKDNFKSFVAGEKIVLPSSWNQFVIANPINGEVMSTSDVTGGVSLPPWTQPAGAPPPPVVVAPPIALPPIPGLPPGLPPIFGGPPPASPPTAPPGGAYVMTLPPGMLTAIKGQLGVWGTREKKITPAGYPSTFDLMPPLGETVDENFRAAVRSFQQWRGNGLRSDGTFDKATHDALNAYTLGVATSPPDAKTPPELPPLPGLPPGLPPPFGPPKGDDTKTPPGKTPAKTPPIAGGGGGKGGTSTKKSSAGTGLAIAGAALILAPMILK